MKQVGLFTWILAFALWAANASAYEVWMGTHLMRSTDAANLSDWSLTASQLDGINVNRAPNDTDPASNNDWRTIFAQFTNARGALHGFARSEATKDPDKVDELAFPAIATRLGEIFGFESTYGYDLSDIMFYDERGTYQGTEYLYVWTDTEIQYMRDWLDANGHADVKLKWNVRNNALRNQQLAEHPLVDSVEIEASTTAFLANTNNQFTYFKWFWDNPALINKEIALQLPRVLPGDPLDQFQGTRRVAKMVGDYIGYGEDGMRSDRLIFLPVTYGDDFLYLPETVSSGTAYTNTMASIALSLIEQRQLFEGRLPQLPTIADADSKARTAPPTISPLIDRVVNKDSVTPAIPFTVGDADTALTSLTLSATSSNPLAVPTSGIVFGGSGANRSVTITPAGGQSGMSVITITVNDGTWSASSTFMLTVGGFLVSQSADASVKDNSTTADTSATTTLLGAGGSSPFVDRATVYVFQLPNLGAIANPFTGASFTCNYVSKEGTLKNNDLYGLGRRSSASVLGSDYYGQSTTADPTDATRLQSNILTNSTPFGAVGTSASGNTALLNYLNAQYASGAGAGQYVFLRLNTTAAKSGINRAKLTMAEGAVSNLTTDTRSRIAYTTVSDPGIGGLAATSVRQDTSTVIPFTIINMSATSLVVNATSSNTTLLPNSGIVIGGSGLSRTLTITPAAGQSGQTDITVTANNGTQSANTTFKLTVLRLLLPTTGDAEVEPTLTTPPYALTNTGWVRLSVGTGGTLGKDRCVVFPFQIPNLGAIANPFNSASLSVNHESNSNTPLGNIAVYGLGSRDADTVLADDYWSATAATDTTDAILLQSDFIPAGSTGFGLRTMDTTGGANLVAYLNSQYAGGAGIGKFVFLRLSCDAAQTVSTSRYLITSADGAGSDSSIHPQINFLTNDQLNIPVITLVTLGTPVDETLATAWSDGLAPHAGAEYRIPSTGNVRGPTGTSSNFPGISLTVEAGGKYQVRALEGSSQVAAVNQLVLEGGSGFTAGDFAELAAGTGNGETNVLDGSITNSGFNRFTSYGTSGGSTIARNLRVQSLISGFGRIQASEGSALRLSTVYIDNPNNSFLGTWEVAPGSSLVFANAGAAGTANIEVQDGGVLEIKGNWSVDAALAVADAPNTTVKLGTYGWNVSDLVLGSTSVADGVYTAADLNALGTNPLFTGVGTVTVGGGLPGGPIAHWKLDEGSGTTAIDSSGGGKPGMLLPGASFLNDPTRGTVVSFDGNLGRITTPFTYTLSSSDDFTWTWWAKRTATGSNGAVMVGNRYPEGSPAEKYEFVKFTPVEAQFANTESAATIDKYDYAALPLNAWNHYAMVKTGNSYQWYVNGVAEGAPLILSYNEDTPIPFNIGGDDDGSGTKTAEHFTGLIDDVALYNRPLTPAEVQAVRDGSYGFLPPNTGQEDWREFYFGSTENTGNAADDYDANFDGENNLLEFATGQDPFASTFAEISVTLNGANLEFRYSRSNVATGDGIQFTVEWTDSLLPGTWSSAGVTDVAAPEDPENPGSSEIQKRIATMPAGSAGKRFLHLKIIH